MPFYCFKPRSGLDLQIKAGWAIVHVWWKRVWLYSIGQANQNVVLSTASVNILLQGDLGYMFLPEKFLKITCSALNLRAFQTYCYIGQWGNSCLNCTHVSYSYLLIYNYFNQHCYHVAFTDSNDPLGSNSVIQREMTQN